MRGKSLPKNNELEHKGLELIIASKKEGILQSEMWKKLGVTSREGSKMALKFEEKGIIERKKVLHDGRWTYRLYPQTKSVTIDSIRDCPCIICEELDKCFSGGQKSPLICKSLTQWITPN
jgi:DNA-binding MarR family transcriptional regulator